MGDKVALVLGGAGGIGSAVSRRLARESSIVIGCRSHVDRADALASELVAEGARVTVAQGDATTGAGMVALFDAAASVGELSTVVHCIGGWAYPKLIDLTEEHIDYEFGLNLRSALLALRESGRQVADGGRVVLLSSAAADVAPPRMAVYAAAKAGLEAAARVAAKEFAPRNITVNVVRPGATDTETLRSGTSDKAIEAMAGANALGRLATPDDIAGVVAFLCSEDARWVTGAVVDATGGLR